MANAVEPVIGATLVRKVTIADSASLSDAADLGSKRLVGVLLAASTEGSVVTFQVSVDGVNYFDLYSAAGEYSIAFTDPCALIVSAVDFLAFPYVKIRTGTSGSASAQTGAQTVYLLAA